MNRPALWAAIMSLLVLSFGLTCSAANHQIVGEITAISITTISLLDDWEYQAPTGTRNPLDWSPGEKEAVYTSSVPGLSAVVRHTYGPELSDWSQISGESIRVVRDDQVLMTIEVNGPVERILWNPTGRGFVYTQFSLWGDFPHGAVRYVTISDDQGDGKNQIKEIAGEDEFLVDFIWSPDGRHLVYSAAGRITVWEPDSERAWDSEVIVLRGCRGEPRRQFSDQSPFVLSSLCWGEGRDIVFQWKDHPYDDRPGGWAVVEMTDIVKHGKLRFTRKSS